MPRMNQSALAIYIPLSQIVETGNVRTDYDEEKIIELAESIKLNGLINPVTVKLLENENDEIQYELIAGHRRHRAYQYLCKQGFEYSMIPACVKNGDKNRMQLIENVQRENLSYTELELALKEMLETGLSQSDIAKLQVHCIRIK